VSTLAERWAGTVSLSIPTLARLIVEIARGLARHGFRRLVLTNYQADPEHLQALARARRALRRDALQVLVAGFSPEPAEQAPMVDPRVRALMRSPRPALEWHAGELETALVMARRPRLVRARIARALRPHWVDVRAPLAGGARRFEELGRRGQGYFGWPRVARAETGERTLALRVRLLGGDLLARLDAWRPPRMGGRRRRAVTPGGREAAS
jgi:creatinine amidohydrolase/Fe(II)-dependent formamide hydrolase-like protein